MLRLTTILFGLGITFNLFSQEWFPNGASWYYTQIILFEGETYNYFEVTGDTLIQGKECKIISGSCFCGIPNVGGILYEEGDRVFAYNEEADSFRILYDFNLVAGDTLIFEGDPNGAGDGMVLIDSITYIQVGSLNLRVQHITHLSFYVVWGDKIIERIGSTSCLYPQDGVCDPHTGGLRCYEDPEIGLINFQNPERPCDFISSLSTVSDFKTIKVYPNPASNILHIETDQVINKISLFNILSVQYYSSISINNTIAELNTKDLPQGIYYLQILTSDNQLWIKPILIQK